MKQYILAIESSCDDTSAAVMDTDFMCLSNVTASQQVHQQYGGVVPELASRSHQQNIIPVVDVALQKAGITKKDLAAVAFTRGPGLLGSLLVGVSFAKTFAMALDIPVIDVNHLHAHVLAHFVKDEDNAVCPQFPYLCMLVSGGNTQIIKVNDYNDMEIIGKTIDDAAGETIDKAAKILSLPYPGGPHIDRLAKQGKPSLQFARSHIQGYDYSFSGLKTSILYTLRDKLKDDPQYLEHNLNDIACSVQKAVVDSLLDKFDKALRDTGIKTVALAGGVSANSLLRERFNALGQKYGCRVFIPRFSYTTDNAAMVAACGVFKFKHGEFAPLNLTAYAR
ncbi:MAG: tRNA (adenosine(37)-N6)-threonylcarbamoyltransferase complex transferase subunit TsaD [Bacteroidales bacterium]|nr:tRNA (adenosine(37)-N6)-threonylcarbamoyltransferase complex transferase subunit TsaD [Bacteroidales bacterium]